MSPSTTSCHKPVSPADEAPASPAVFLTAGGGAFGDEYRRVAPQLADRLARLR